MAKFRNGQLAKLNSTEAIVRLLQSEKLDFQETLRHLEYQEELEELQAELIKLQKWIIDENARVLIIVEGREFSGKGHLIRVFTRHLQPRAYRIVALPKPTENQRDEWYYKRYIDQLPKPGEIVFFDRSWYNRAIVEPVNDFCTDAEYHRFMSTVNLFEDLLLRDGLKMVKYYMSISKEEQIQRIKRVKSNPLRRWELSPVDLQAVDLWDKYTEYKERMFEIGAHLQTTWEVIESDDPPTAHLSAIQHCLGQFPYKGEG